jgi:YD repeat-containing protein
VANPKSLTIAGTTFQNHHYDQRGDVLYLSVAHYDGPSAKALSTPEGHNIEYDAAGRVVAMTLTNVSWLLDRDGEIAITVPARYISSEDLAQALRPAAGLSEPRRNL